MFDFARHEIEKKMKDTLIEKLARHGKLVVKGVGEFYMTSDNDIAFKSAQSLLNAVHRKQRE